MFCFIFNLKPVYCTKICISLFICISWYIFSESTTSECCTFHMAPHIYGFLYALGQCPPWTVKQSSFYPRPVLAFGYCRCLRLSVRPSVRHKVCPRDNSSPVQARATKFGSEVLNTLVKIPVVLGVDWAWHVKFNSFSKSCLFASLLLLWIICETCKKRMKRSLFPIVNSYAHICSPTETCHGLWNSGVISLVWPLLASQSSTRWLAMDFCMLL